MNSLNSILIEGNLIRDPDFCSTVRTGTTLCEFVIGVKRYFKVDNEYQKEVSFFTIQTWSRLAEACGKYLKKGRGVRVIGRLKQNRWTEENNESKSRVIIIADHVEFKPEFKGKEKQG